MPDLSDAFDWIRRLIYKVDRLEGGAMLENASVTEGRLRFIGGLLRVDSGGRVEIVGTLQVDGESTVTGQFTVEGPWALTGDGTITGAVSIEGPVTISGDVDLTGLMNVTGDIVVDGTGSIKVEGTGSILVTGTGGIKVSGSGNIEVTGTGKIKVGTAMTFDPGIENGSIVFGNGAQVFTDADTIQVYFGNSVVQIEDGSAKLQTGGSVIEIDETGARISLAAIDTAASSDGLHWLAIDTSTGYLKRLAPGTGGPSGSGDFVWPFDPVYITSGFRTIDRPTHDGLDFSYGGIGGDPIAASGAGVVAAAEYSSGYGNYVDINHAPVGGHTIMTRYGHMQTAPLVTVGDSVVQGQNLGPVGNTGASFGDHLHWETWVDGEPIDPVIFMATYGAP